MWFYLSPLKKLTFFFIVAYKSDRKIYLFGKEIVAEKRITFRFIVEEPQAEFTILTQARLSLHHITPRFTKPRGAILQFLASRSRFRGFEIGTPRHFRVCFGYSAVTLFIDALLQSRLLFELIES